VKTLFLVLAGWLVIITLGIIAGLIFNKIIIDKKLLNIFNIALVIILFTITVYFVITMKNLL
jgi:hypothetical protein